MRNVRLLFPILAVLGVTSCDDPATAPLESFEPVNARRGHPTEVIDLGTLGGSWSEAFDVNNKGIVVGGAETVNGVIRAFRWTREGGMRDLGALSGGFSEAIGINERGAIVGISGDDSGIAHLVLWSPSGRINDLGAFPEGMNVFGLSINDRNEIVGNYFKDLLDQSLNIPYHWTERTGIVDFPWGNPSASGEETFAGAINNRGDVVGFRGDQIFLSERGIGFRILNHPWLYAFTHAVNDHRVIVGRAVLATGGSNFVPFRWTPKRGFQSLGNFGERDAWAIDVNNRGEIVGSTYLGPKVFRSFYWLEERGVIDLGTGLVNAINEHALIVGSKNGRATMWIGTGGLPDIDMQTQYPMPSEQSAIAATLASPARVKSRPHWTPGRG